MIFTTILFISPVYIMCSLFTFFYDNTTVLKWFLYSLLFTLPILAISLLLSISKNSSGFVGGEALALLPVALLALLLFITTPFYLHSKSKKIQSAK